MVMENLRFCFVGFCLLWIIAYSSTEEIFNITTTDSILISNVSQSLSGNSTDAAELVVETRSLNNRWCDWSFSERDFVVSSPNYPQAYQSNLDCVISVRRAQDTCRLLLIFEHFHLEQSEGCHADYLEVNDDRLCGTLPPKTTRTFTFTGSTIEIRFHSNAFTEDGGFLIRASQIVCGQEDSRASSSVADDNLLLPKSNNICDKTFTQTDFEITSPGYPQPYPNNVDCLYAIRKSSAEICALQITIAYLDVEVTQECFSSFIEWNQQRFCFPPEINTQLFVFKETVFYIRFRSGLNPRRRLGFRLHVLQQKCLGPNPNPYPPFPPNPPVPPPFPGPNPPGYCNWNLIQQNNRDPLVFELQSPGYPTSYPNNLNCIYRVQKATPTVCALEFTVQTFDVEDSVNCQYDFLSVDNNRFCGRLLKGTTRFFNFFQPEINIIFHSDERGAGCGFSLIFRQRDNCFVPPRPPIPPPPRPPLPPPIPIPTPNVHRCGATFATVGFVIVSPLVTVDTVCTYLVKKVGKKCALTLQFAEFDFGVNDLGCSRAYLEIRGERLCSHIIEGSTRSYIFEGDEFLIKFRSGISRPTFRINALQRECPGPGPIPPPLPPTPPICENCKEQGPTVFITKEFRFSSPNFPQPYFPNLNCVYKVVKTSLSVCQLRILVVEFDLEASYNCQKDSLNIGGIKLCGRRLIGFSSSFDFFQRELVIRFESDAFGSGRGFLIDAFQEDCSNNRADRTPPPFNPIVPQLFSPLCNRSYHMDEFEVKYEDYPNYRGPLQCRYSINKIHKEICVLEIEYKQFNLETSPSCAADYLEVSGQRHCGLMTPSSIRRYDFPEDKFEINIASEHGFSHPLGLHLRLRQLPCDTATLNSNDIAVNPYLPQPALNNYCDLETDKIQFSWISPNYPNLYNNNQQCILVIKKNHNSICAVDMMINYFLLEQSAECSKDYVEILGRRFCGQISQQQRTLPFEVDMLTLRFNSDKNIPLTGFHLLFQQRNCDINGSIFKRYSLENRQLNSSESDYALSNMSRSLEFIEVTSMAPERQKAMDLKRKETVKLNRKIQVL